MNASTAGFFVSSLGLTGSGSNSLSYNTTTNEIFCNTGKTFVIPHPTDKARYLVHACLEGPEAGIYYRGKGEITNDKNIIIELPDYAKHIGTEFTVHLTPIDVNGVFSHNLRSSEVLDGKFTVYGSNGTFHWIVHGLRKRINVEPLIEESNVEGNGPYLYIK